MQAVCQNRSISTSFVFSGLRGLARARRARIAWFYAAGEGFSANGRRAEVPLGAQVVCFQWFGFLARSVHERFLVGGQSSTVRRTRGNGMRAVLLGRTSKDDVEIELETAIDAVRFSGIYEPGTVDKRIFAPGSKDLLSDEGWIRFEG